MKNQNSSRVRKLKDFSNSSNKEKFILMTISVTGGVLFWFLMTKIPTINTFLASPLQVFKSLLSESMANGRYFKDIAISLQQVLIGFGLAFICSIPIAF